MLSPPIAVNLGQGKRKIAPEHWAELQKLEGVPVTPTSWLTACFWQTPRVFVDDFLRGFAPLVAGSP